MTLQTAKPAQGRVAILEQANEEEGDTGWWPHVLFDHNDQPHVAFCDAHRGDVRYGREIAGHWKIEAVVSKGAVGKYLSLDLDSRGQPGIAYYDQDKMYLRYASPDPAGTWSTEPVAWGREVGMGMTLRFDRQDRPHIFYYLPSGKFVHASRDDSGWRKEVLGKATGVYSARTSVVAREDGLWVSFVDWQMRNTTLYLGHVTSDGHTSQTLVTQAHGPGWHSQLLFDGPEPVLFHSQDLTRQTAMTRRGAEGWQTVGVVPHGSIFAAERWRDAWLLAYQDTSDMTAGGVLRYAISRRKAPWTVYTVDDDGPVGGQMSLAISSHGRLLLVYYADALRSLKLYDEQLPLQWHEAGAKSAAAARGL